MIEDTLNCPKCSSPMEKVNFSDVEVDRCTNCKGIWFDLLEHEKLKEIEGSETIDTGDPDVGKKYNKIENIICPVCKTNMVKMVDNEHPHIWYESCATCYGVFFDAGEFKDYKEDTFLGFIKDMFTKERK